MVRTIKAAALCALCMALCGCAKASAPTSAQPELTVAPRTLQAQMLEEYADAYARNSDLAGWVRIEDTRIDYPVMYTPQEPEKYLRLAFNGRYDFLGVPFMDAACAPGDGTRGYFIYGHNTYDGTMFGSLKEYLDEDYRAAHPLIEFDTLYARGLYEVFAVFLSQVYGPDDDVFKYYQYACLCDEDTFERYVENVRKLSVFDSALQPRWGDTLLTLSTCSHHVENGRLAVVAVKIEDR
ncbi:MAG: class B sortase [Oscillospiraceae bacterium]|nr:class B sortase [Oscillospiraceae bacterium]